MESDRRTWRLSKEVSPVTVGIVIFQALVLGIGFYFRVQWNQETNDKKFEEQKQLIQKLSDTVVTREIEQLSSAPVVQRISDMDHRLQDVEERLRQVEQQTAVFRATQSLLDRAAHKEQK